MASLKSMPRKFSSLILKRSLEQQLKRGWTLHCLSSQSWGVLWSPQSLLTRRPLDWVWVLSKHRKLRPSLLLGRRSRLMILFDWTTSYSGDPTRISATTISHLNLLLLCFDVPSSFFFFLLWHLLWFLWVAYLFCTYGLDGIYDIWSFDMLFLMCILIFNLI